MTITLTADQLCIIMGVLEAAETMAEAIGLLVEEGPEVVRHDIADVLATIESQCGARLEDGSFMWKNFG